MRRREPSDATPTLTARLPRALMLVGALALGCEPRESASTECPSVVRATLSMLVEIEGVDTHDETGFDVATEGPLEVTGPTSFRVVGEAGAVSVTVSGTAVPELEDQTEVRLRVFRGHAQNQTDTDTEYVELVDAQTDALLFAGMNGEPAVIEGARVQVATQELCASSEGGGGDDVSLSFRRAVVTVDGVEVSVGHESTEILSDLGLEVEHQGTVFQEIYDFVESESAIVVRPEPGH